MSYMACTTCGHSADPVCRYSKSCYCGGKVETFSHFIPPNEIIEMSDSESPRIDAESPQINEGQMTVDEVLEEINSPRKNATPPKRANIAREDESWPAIEAKHAGATMTAREYMERMGCKTTVLAPGHEGGDMYPVSAHQIMQHLKGYTIVGVRLEHDATVLELQGPALPNTWLHVSGGQWYAYIEESDRDGA